MNPAALRQVATDAPAGVPSARAVDVTVHRIHRGTVRSGTVRSRLPSCVTTTRFEAGPLMPHGDAVLAAVVATATRCAPWLRVYIGPRVWSTCDPTVSDVYACRPNVRPLPHGLLRYEHHGLACWDDDVVLVASAARLTAVVPVVHHEIWHAVERLHLAADDVAVMSRITARGQSRPGTYLGSDVERRARLYEAWAVARDEGWRPVSVLGRPVRWVDRILAYVYDGGLARDLAAGRPARCQRSRMHTIGVWLRWCLLQPESTPYPL